MRFVYLYAIYQCIRGLFRYSSNVKMKSKQKKRLQNRPTPFFILSIVKRDYVSMIYIMIDLKI